MASGFQLVFFLCMISGLLIEGTWSTRVKRWPGCPSGWTKYGCRCFYVFTSRRTMAAAEELCQYYGGHLASIHSYSEYLAIRKMIYKRYRSNVRAWIGMFDAIQEGKWMWTDGSSVVYTNWGKGEPNNNHNNHPENCAEINSNAGFYWNDLPCRKQKPFVCARTV